MQYKDQLKAETDLVALISQYTKLTKVGNKWVGRCPHPDHEDKHPSFYIYSNNKGELVWFCHGCCAQGDDWGDPKFYGHDCYGFLRWMSDYEGSPHILSFSEAIAQIREFRCVKKSVVRENLTASKDPVTDPKIVEELFRQEALMAHAAHANLLRGPKNILYQRGLDDQDIEEWQIGFRQIGKNYRISFPLFDKNKKVLGYIARVIGAGYPKYINSETSPIFHKGKYLYGIHRVQSQKEITIVEGVFDVILGYKYGLTNLAACLCSNPDTDILSSWEKITLMLDSDEAGKEGTQRTVERLRDNHELWICELPEKDLGDFAPKIKDGLVDFVENNKYKVC